MSAEAPPLELWGGIECTLNRVGDEYRDQLRYSGHAERVDDLDAIAALGIRAIRYPVLWERVAPDGLARASWAWTDERLHRLRALDVRPIAGLVHHGSGPHGTSLLDPAFAEGLEAYAAAVAARYPWVDAFTPVNEPVTTARFSALYGHWYPHERDDCAFVRALLHQIEGVHRAMAAIRRVNPRARLVQTEDAGRTYARGMLRPQARFDTRRNRLTFDLLLGRVNAAHPLYRWLADRLGTTARLDHLARNPCPPDIVGLNYYVTSDRWLDERLDAHPPHSHGGNGRQAYADVEAVRVRRGGCAGHFRVLMDAWRAFGRPLALTEVHLGCSREEQLRWLRSSWRAAHAARRAGADVRAVTAWSLLGAFDWNSLVTRVEGHYEPGAFDVRSTPIRPTAIAAAMRSLCRTGKVRSALAAQRGWWKRDGATTSGRPILITGAGGTLGRAFVTACGSRGLHMIALTRDELDITDAAAVDRLLDAHQPWAILNTAGYVHVDEAETDVATCRAVNTDGAVTLAAACAARRIRLVAFSSDLVFDGALRRPYVEADAVAPLGVYGHSKAEAERRVLQVCPSSLAIRTSAFFGPEDDANFVTTVLRELQAGHSYEAADDAVVSPTYVPDLVSATLDLLIDGETGLWHLANRGETTWFDFARRAVQLAGFDPLRVERRPIALLTGPARRPVYSALGSARGSVLPDLDAALARYFHDRGTIQLSLEPTQPDAEAA